MKEAIIVALEKDPSITADDISKGNSIGFNPMIASPATAHKDTLSNFVKMIRTKFDCSGYSCRNTIEQFDAIVKANIDEKDSKLAESEELNRRVLNLSTPYIR